MGLFGGDKVKSYAKSAPVDPHWARDAKGRFFRLMRLDTDQAGLPGKGGVFVIWHQGVKPQWVYVGAANNLGAAVDACLDNEEITGYETNGGLYVTWCLIKPDFQPRVQRYLINRLGPLVDDPKGPPKGTDPVPVFPPSLGTG